VPAADPDEEVRYGVIGTGMMGVEHLQNLKHVPGARVTAVADPHPRSREHALTVLDGDVASFEDHRALLAADACDAVVIASPNMTHVDVLLDVLAAGVHVLVEKPLCTTVQDCRRVVAAAAGHPGVVWVGLEYRYMPPVARLVEEVAAGTVGRLRMLSIREHRFPFLAKVGDWNRFNANTGGTLVEKCCHFFDLMNLVCEGRPVRVLASGGQDVNHLDEVYDGRRSDILDNAYVIVEYEGGTRALLDLCMFAEATTNMEELAAVGDAGKVEAFLPSSELRFGRREDGWFAVRSEIVADDRVAYEGSHHGSSFLEHLDFLDAVRTGGPPVVSLEDGLLSVAVGVAAHRSIEQRRPVDLDEVLEG
jgi:myo-inositol 2-dehydrogenase/D-chiro-inositol 1-dehydrogenase